MNVLTDELAKYFDKNKILELIGASDAWQASDKLLKILMNKDEREELFRKFLEINSDLSFDWFCKFFSDEMAERTKKKQFFTPYFYSDLTSRLVSDGLESHSNFDSASGSGSLTVAKWNEDRLKSDPFIYRPSDYWYVCEELKIEKQPSRVLPFLLFNFLIRGMNGIVISGDSLNRKISQIYFIQNINDDSLGFSSLNVMPRLQTVEKEFNVKGWIDEPINHIEDQSFPDFLMRKIDNTLTYSETKFLNKAEKIKSLIDGLKITPEEMHRQCINLEENMAKKIETKIKAAIKIGNNEVETELSTKKPWRLRNQEILNMVANWAEDEGYNIEFIGQEKIKLKIKLVINA